MQLPFLLGSSWWLNQPLWKICSSKWVHLPHFGGEHKKYWRNHHPGIVSAYFFQGANIANCSFLREGFGIPPAFSTLHDFGSHISVAAINSSCFRPKKKHQVTKNKNKCSHQNYDPTEEPPMKTCQFLVAKFMKRTLFFWTHSFLSRLRPTKMNFRPYKGWRKLYSPQRRRGQDSSLVEGSWRYASKWFEVPSLKLT